MLALFLICFVEKHVHMSHWISYVLEEIPFALHITDVPTVGVLFECYFSSLDKGSEMLSNASSTIERPNS